VAQGANRDAAAASRSSVDESVPEGIVHIAATTATAPDRIPDAGFVRCPLKDGQIGECATG
jgi:hypothetical protein